MDFNLLETDIRTARCVSRRDVTKAFKMNGLTLQAAALTSIMNVLQREQSDPMEVLRAIVEQVREHSVAQSQSIVTKSLLAEVVADMSRTTKDVSKEALQLLSAFETPRLTFDTLRRQQFTLHHDKQGSRSLFGAATDKVEMFQQRYAIVLQRVLRQDLFRPKLVSAEGRGASTDDRNVFHRITPIEALLGRIGVVRFLLGMIVQVEEGRYYLEDVTAQVPLDLSDAQLLTDGFITENCIVLVEAEMLSDGILHVHRMGNPLIERRADSIASIGYKQTDLFNTMSTIAEVEKMREEELVSGPDCMFVMLSDVHLDKPKVLEKLQVLFRGLQDLDPLPVFVLMGNFTSAVADPKTLAGYLEELATLLSIEFPRVAQGARIVLVPGPNDPGTGQVLPRPPLPNYCTRALKSKCAHIHFATNPCRIRYFSKELVVFRQNSLHLLHRQSIVAPRSDSDMVQHTVKTILDQGHLSPSAGSRPIYWQFDHAMRLYPLPDAVISADRVDQFYENYADCDVINPGPFSKDFSFVVYRPIAEVDSRDQATKSDVEFSQIGEEEL